MTEKGAALAAQQSKGSVRRACACHGSEEREKKEAIEMNGMDEGVEAYRTDVGD